MFLQQSAVFLPDNYSLSERFGDCVMICVPSDFPSVILGDLVVLRGVRYCVKKISCQKSSSRVLFCEVQDED